MLDVRPAAPARTDVSVLLVADGPEVGLTDAVRSVLAALDAAARGVGPGHPGGLLRGDRLGGELVLAVRDVAALPALPRADPRLRVLAVPGAGGGQARNLATAAARGRYLLLTTPDARVPGGWVAAMVAPLRAGRADLVAGTERSAGSGPAPDAFPVASCGAARAVLEVLGFDEALRPDRFPDAAVTAVFRADAVGAGFRVQVVAGVPVDRPDRRTDRRPDRRTDRRDRARAGRDRGRTDAYLDRHLRGAPGHRTRAATLAAFAREALRLGWARCVGGPAARSAAGAEAARLREAVRLSGGPERDRPRPAAGDLPGGSGGARSAAPVVLVARLAVPPTVLPALPGAADPVPVPGAGCGSGEGVVRGSAHQLWPSAGGSGFPPAPDRSPRPAAGQR